MDNSAMRDAFDHHVWATLRLLDACHELSPEQREYARRGTYGSILATARHLVGADAFYQAALGVGPDAPVDEEALGLVELRDLMESLASAWVGFLAADVDPASMVEEHEPDGYERRASVSMRLAQALHHGTDHRSQICTMLTDLGVEPPIIDVWQFGLETGRISEVVPNT